MTTRQRRKAPVAPDLRHRFPLGRLQVVADVIPKIAAVVGGEVEARFRLGTVLHRHQCGWGGRISIEDRMLNEHILKEHALRGSTHAIVSVHMIESVAIHLVTHLGNRTTKVSLGCPSSIVQQEVMDAV